jgi:imidazole glycerol-phosphate synthase subunit HisH
MIVIVDYGMGNLGSILNMLKKIGAPAKISSDRAEIAAGDKLILPGVGAFDTAMRNLHESGLKDVLDEQVLAKKVPTLGVCLGMQLLTDGSEEGNLPGLGWITGTTKKFRFEAGGPDASLKVPHMGWNTIVPAHTGDARSPLVSGLDDPTQRTRFYFVHSYHVTVQDPADAAASTHHGHDFVSMVHKAHIMGTQFHPEKSHKFGMRLYRNFAEMP